MSSEPKTKATSASVDEFLRAIGDPQKQADSRAICKLMQEATGQPPKMWGSSIVGFGMYHYKYASGREGDWPAAGFSPRKQQLTLYLAPGFDGEYKDLLGKLGPHTTAKACLYIKRLADVDAGVLRELVGRSYRQITTMYPPVQ